MLKIWYGDLEDVIFNPDIYFDTTFEPSWLLSDLAKEVIKDVDKSEVLSAHCIQSPVLGQIPPHYLSGGTKTLILMANDDSEVYNATACGNNCAK